MKYEIGTIKDIFDKIPTDKLSIFMEELTVLIYQTKAWTSGEGKFPKIITWNDDGKGEIITNIIHSGNEIMTIKTQLINADISPTASL